MKAIFFLLVGALSVASLAFPHSWPGVYGYLALPQLTLLYTVILVMFFWHVPALSVTLLPAVCLGIWTILQTSIPHIENTAKKPASFNIVSLNLWKDNQNPYASLDALARNTPNIITLQEIDAERWGSLEAIVVDSYPYRKRAWNGVVIASTYPIIKSVEAHEAFPDTFTEAAGFLHSQLSVKNKIVHVVVLHTNSSRSNDDIEKRHRQLKRLANYITKLKGRVVVTGDLNAPFWDPKVRKFMKTARLNMPEISWFYGSWPTWLPGFIRTRFDYVLYRNLNLQSFETLEGVGSDHAPVKAVFRKNLN